MCALNRYLAIFTIWLFLLFGYFYWILLMFTDRHSAHGGVCVRAG